MNFAFIDRIINRTRYAELDRLRAALIRLSEPVAFRVATANISTERKAIILFAKSVMDGASVQEAEELVAKKGSIDA